MKSAFSHTKNRLRTSGKESISELIRVYQDLEKTLMNLREAAPRGAGPARHLNLPRLIEQLSLSKRRLERKIHNTLLLEKEGFKRNIRRMLRS